GHLRAVAAPARQRELLAQAAVARGHLVVAQAVAAARGAQARRHFAALLQPGLEVAPLGLVAGDERVLPHARRPSSQLAMPNSRTTPASPRAPVTGVAMSASSSRRCGVSVPARSAKAI